MRKKNLECYETPAIEILDVNVESQLMASSPQQPTGGVVDDSNDITGGNSGLFGE